MNLSLGMVGINVMSYRNKSPHARTEMGREPLVLMGTEMGREPWVLTGTEMGRESWVLMGT